MKMFKYALMALMGVAAFGLTACNTIDGIGKDVERAGEEIQKTAD